MGSPPLHAQGERVFLDAVGDQLKELSAQQAD
jgi:hypothetical protein